MVNLFGQQIEKLKFFILPSFISFDGIIGNDSLKQLNAIIHTNDGYMIIEPGVRIPLKEHISEFINALNIRTTHMTKEQTNRLKSIINRCPNLFSDPDEKLTYTTIVKGEIRTTTSDPVYSKSYPYPMALKTIVEEEIKKLLDNGTIRPSKSPYNSPIWVVPKKMDASGEKKYRLVIDYRKLNSVTIPDRYL